MDELAAASTHALQARIAGARRIARALTRDAERADDAVQEAFAAAVEHGDDVEPGWLAQVVRNAVRRLGRADARRARREVAAARPEPAAPTDALSAEAEIVRDLAAAVLALDEPYRSTIVLRFYHERSSAEIARLQGVPSATVRSRLMRGLGELRARLDARYGERGAWIALLGPLAKSASSPRSADLGRAAGGLATGGLLMSIPGKIAILGAVLASVAALLLVRNDTEPGPQPSGERVAETASAPADERAEARVEPRGELAALIAAGAAPSGRRAVAPVAAQAARIRVRARTPDGGPVAGATVLATPRGRNEPLLARATTNADGLASLSVGDVDGLRLVWSAPDLRGGNGDFDELDTELELRFTRTAHLTGVVTDASTGAVIDGAHVWYEEHAETDATGTYELGGIPVGYDVSFAVRAAGYGARRIEVRIPDPGEHRVDVALPPAVAMPLRVVDRETELPIAGAKIRDSALAIDVATTDAHGLARVEVAVGAGFDLAAVADGYRSVHWVASLGEAPAPEGEPVASFPLTKLGWAQGRVLAPDGAPLAGTWVGQECPGSSTPALDDELRERYGLSEYAYESRVDVDERTGDDGRFRIPILSCDGTVVLVAGHPDHPAVRTEPLPAPPSGGVVRADLRFRRSGGAHGLVTRNGKPWRDGEVLAFDADGYGLARVGIDSDGRFSLSGLTAGPVRLELRGTLSRTVLASAEVVVPPDDLVEQHLAWTQSLDFIRGRVVDSGGAPSAGARVFARSRDRRGVPRSATASADAEGAFALEVAAGALFDVRATHGDRTSATRSDVVAGTEGLELVLIDRGTLRLALVDAETGAPIATTTGTPIVTWSRNGAGGFGDFRRGPDVNGEVEATVDAGRFDVHVHAASDGYAPARVDGVSVPADGESERVVIRLERGVTARLMLEGTEEMLGGHLFVLVHEKQLDAIAGPPPDGESSNWTINGISVRIDDPALRNQMLAPPTPGRHALTGLSPGRYHVRVYPDDLACEPEVFDLPAPDDATIELRLLGR